MSFVLAQELQKIGYAQEITNEADIQAIPLPLGIFQQMLNVLNNIYNSLANSIAPTLQQIADKNTTVIVEPPQVNITLPEKDCKWEKLNQYFPIEASSSIDGWAFFDIPHDIKYSNVTFERFSLGCINGCTIRVNGGSNDCDAFGGSGIFDANNCLQRLHEGANYMSENVHSPYGVRAIYVEMSIKPANC